jgi:hypothetical protein
VAPGLNRRRAVFIREKTKEQEKDTRFVELGEYLCEVRSKQYWRLEKLKSFDEFLEKRFLESRRKAYYLMAINEHLPRIAKPELRLMGWTKARELVKVARRAGQTFDCAPWVHKASSMPREEFKQEVVRHLTGQETEPHEILYFKMYKSQPPVIEEALENAGLMLGSDKSRGYCLEMICADFLAGANLNRGAAKDLTMQRSLNSPLQRQKRPRLRLDPKDYAVLRTRVLERDGWRCQERGSMEGLEVHHVKPSLALGVDSITMSWTT